MNVYSALRIGAAMLAVNSVPGVSNAATKPLEEIEPEHPGHRHAAHPNLLGFRVGYLSVWGEKDGELEQASAFLAGVSYERTVIHEWLEIEVSVPLAVIFEEETILALPMDLHFKKPFHPVPQISPYLALGPAVDVEVSPQTRAFFGGSFAVGTYVWPSTRVGLDLEVDYNVVAVDGRPAHEFLVAIGPVLRL